MRKDFIGSDVADKKVVTEDANWGSRAAALLKCLHTKDTSQELFRDLLPYLGEIDRKRLDYS